MTPDAFDSHELGRQLGAVRRAMLRDGLVAALTSVEDVELSLPQMAVLLLLDDLGPQKSSALAGYLGRSPSATSRLIDQLVQRGWVSRREDDQDRRARLITLEPPGKAFLDQFEQRRAQAQLAVMAHLTAEERARVMEAMRLLAQAAQRSRS